MQPRNVLVLVLVGLCLLACGGSQRQKTLHTSFVAVTAACDGLFEWDQAKEEQIVDKADPSKTTKDELQKQIADHRAKMDKLYASCGVAVRAIAAASLNKDDLTLKTAGIKAQEILDEIAKLKEAL